MIINETTKSKIIDTCSIKDVARAETLADIHLSTYGRGEYIFSSPGRVELVGNHTDHNRGKVMASAINLDIMAIVGRCDGYIRINSEGYPPFEVNLEDVSKVDSEEGTSIAVVKGVAHYFATHGKRIGGFCATMNSNVPKGAGVSSSAAFEVLVGEIISYLYNDDSIPYEFLAQAAHYAEVEYFGKPCGLLDQFAIAAGGVTYMDFENPAEPIVERLTPQFEGVSMVLIATGGDHSDLTEHYASIRAEMEAVAGELGEDCLRRVPIAKFEESIPLLKQNLGGRPIMRALHFFEENKRVDMARQSVVDNRDDLFYYTLTQSGMSSYQLLQNCYVPGDVDQFIPLALTISARCRGVRGYRVHGGGFAGTILTFCEDKYVEEYVKYMSTLFPSVSVLKFRQAGAICLGDL